jgi:hypothetical protein
MVVLQLPTLVMLREASTTSDVQYYCLIFRIQVRPQVGMAVAQQLVRPQRLTHLQGLSRMLLQKLLPQLMLKLKYTHHCQVSKTLSTHRSQGLLTTAGAQSWPETEQTKPLTHE